MRYGFTALSKFANSEKKNKKNAGDIELISLATEIAKRGF